MAQDQRVKLGRITTVYGVKGWVKVFSSTEPMPVSYTHLTLPTICSV